MILRLIALAVLVLFLYRMARRALRSLLPESGSPAAQQPSESQPMVPCKTCGTFIPRERTLADDRGHLYCSPECRDKARDLSAE